MTGSLLIAGTASDVGKSVITTGLCRAFANRGISVAPFKAQNMSNNSMVCADGAEIGRAQWIQAAAARAEPEAAMNPVLLKPGSDSRSHVVVMGQPAGELAASDFFGGRAALAAAANAAFDDLAHRFDVVVCEGAGSLAEINLRQGDFINMGLAQQAGMPTIIVGDIDRGGVFASFIGTLALLDSADQKLIAGYVINKFRGDRSLLTPAIAELEARTRRPAFGVVPWSAGVWLDSEDSLDTVGHDSASADASAPVLRVAVIRLPRISNFTDLDALAIEPGVEVSYVSSASTAGDADLIVIPGTRATIADLAWLRERGIDHVITEHARRGRAVLGICGGYQMLGTLIDDPQGVEGTRSTAAAGLGLLDVTTHFRSDKVLRIRSGNALSEPVAGYEIHHGQVTRGTVGDEFLEGSRQGNVFGTMWHGSLESDGFRRAFLREIGAEPGTLVSFPALRSQRLDELAALCEAHLDVDALLDLALSGPSASLPVLISRLDG